MLSSQSDRLLADGDQIISIIGIRAGRKFLLSADDNDCGIKIFSDFVIIMKLLKLRLTLKAEIEY